MNPIGQHEIIEWINRNSDEISVLTGTPLSERGGLMGALLDYRRLQAERFVLLATVRGFMLGRGIDAVELLCGQIGMRVAMMGQHASMTLDYDRSRCWVGVDQHGVVTDISFG